VRMIPIAFGGFGARSARPQQLIRRVVPVTRETKAVIDESRAQIGIISDPVAANSGVYEREAEKK
jgi:hypothetical protein